MCTHGKMRCADGEVDPGALPDGAEGDGWGGGRSLERVAGESTLEVEFTALLEFFHQLLPKELQRGA